MKKLKNQVVTKLKKIYFDKTEKPKLCQNFKTQIVTKLKTSDCDKTQKLKL